MSSGIITFFKNFIGTMDWSLNWINVLEILIIAITLFVFYQKFIQNTQSEKFVKGALFLVVLWIISEVLIKFQLNILGVFLKSIVTLVAFSLVIIFQPELRRFLGYLGEIDFINKIFGSTKDKTDEKIDVVKEIIESVKYFSKSHT